MGKTIEVRLSDAQHAALSEAAKASGTTAFFSFCRDMLMAGLEMNAKAPGPERTAVRPQIKQPMAVETPADDRISRIEDAVQRLTDYVLQGQQPAPEAPPQQPIDVDSIVNAQFAEAEAQGLTEHVSDEAEQQLAESGVRPLSRRPTPFSAGSAPRHLQQLLG
jgi:hypothetical protein